MNFIEKLDMLMETHNLNRSELSRYSGIPYSTISGLYDKGYDNIKLSTLKKLTEFFDVSIDYMVFDDISNKDDLHSDRVDLNELESYLIQKYRLLDEHGKNITEVVIEAEYSRCTSSTECSQLHNITEESNYYFERNKCNTDSSNNNVTVYRAANSTTNADSEICIISNDHNMRLTNASETDEDF